VVRALALFFALVCSAWSVLAQQTMPVLDSQRQYMPFGEAAEKIIAAAVARAKPASTENISQADSFKRIVEFSKQYAVKANESIGGNGFSYMSFAPHIAATKIYGETTSYTFFNGGVTIAVEVEPRGFRYRMKPVFSTPFTYGLRGPPARIYAPDTDFAFKNMPRIASGAVAFTNLCSGSSNACSALSNYTNGRYRWYYRDSTQSWMYACNEVSDCVQAAVSMFFYNVTFKYRTMGYDDFGQYWGNYNVLPSGTCNDSTEYAYLSFGMISGMTCIYSQQYNYTPSFQSEVFSVTGDYEGSFLRYISLLPVPIVCPGATKYPQILACDARFPNDVLSLDSVVRLVDRMYWWGTQREGYRGVKYTVVTHADALNVLGSSFVKVASLAEPLEAPISTPPVPDPAPGDDGGGDSPALDLGPDPGVGQVELGEVSSVAILEPIWGLFPSLSAWSPGGYAIQCPVFTPAVFGSTLRVDQHCQLLEGQRVALGVLSLVAWAVTALLVLLRA
jgi:hypothetical protein